VARPLPTTATPAAAQARDSYDPAYLALTQDFTATAQVARVWNRIKVEKPPKSRVFRVHPELCLKTTLLTVEGGETYLVDPHVRQLLAEKKLGEPHYLFACVSKNGTPFLWPIRAEDPDGRWNIWPKSAYDIAVGDGRSAWVRVWSDRDAGYYVHAVDEKPPEEQQKAAFPEWPMRRWVMLGFKGLTIEAADHPVVKHLFLED
jgi:hypothetical protein